MFRKILVGAIVAFFAAPSMQQACTTTNKALEGTTAKFTTNADGASGNLKVVNGCSIMVTDLNINAGVPDVYLWAAADAASVGTTGKRISNTKISNQGLQAATLNFDLLPDVDLTKYPHIVMWCEMFKANLAELDLKAVAAPTPTPSGNCAAGTTALVGTLGKLTTLADGASGNFKVIPGCKFMLTDFSLNTGVPDVHVWAATDINNIATTGVRISDTKISNQGVKNETLTFDLLPGIDLSKFTVISIWCEMFKADLAHYELKASTPAPSTDCAAGTTALVGTISKLTTLADGASGNFKVIPGCKFMLTDFSLNTGVPDVHVWAATDINNIGTTGKRISDTKISDQGVKNETLTFDLLAGIDLSKYSVISIWCEMFKANLAQATIGTATTPVGTNTATVAPTNTTKPSSAKALKPVFAGIFALFFVAFIAI
ncbi:hypothetical protein HDU97_002394 [Phlyctochytrium planicorne]|nr:hypothetical protein HDU97_002394 [Phlyctochytrium planicorne]